MSESEKGPRVAQTTTLLFENDPTWADLSWFVEKGKRAGVTPTEPLVFEYDPEDRTGGPIGISFFEHPETGSGA